MVDVTISSVIDAPVEKVLGRAYATSTASRAGIHAWSKSHIEDGKDAETIGCVCAISSLASGARIRGEKTARLFPMRTFRVSYSILGGRRSH